MSPQRERRRISLNDAYAHALASHRHSSDYRMKILGLWIALLPVFFAGIALAKQFSLSIYAAAAATGATLVLLLLDLKNYPAIRAAIDLASDLESRQIMDADFPGLPYHRRIKASNPPISMTFLIWAFGIGTILLFWVFADAVRAGQPNAAGSPAIPSPGTAELGGRPWVFLLLGALLGYFVFYFFDGMVRRPILEIEEPSWTGPRGRPDDPAKFLVIHVKQRGSVLRPRTARHCVARIRFEQIDREIQDGTNLPREPVLGRWSSLPEMPSSPDSPVLYEQGSWTDISPVRREELALVVRFSDGLWAWNSLSYVTQPRRYWRRSAWGPLPECRIEVRVEHEEGEVGAVFRLDPSTGSVSRVDRPQHGKLIRAAARLSRGFSECFAEFVS